MSMKSVFSARNRIAALGYGLLASATTSVALGADNPPTTNDSGDITVVNDFLNNIGTILNAASLVVVTIAIVFAGYQIAFNNKRISEVAPVLLGGVLIGGASQIAAMLINSGSVGTAGGT
jgi:type IV secretion system protein VirB2